MARLTATDKEQVLRLGRSGWRQSAAERSPHRVEQTIAGRERYCRWAAAASRFFKGCKPVRFGGSNWKL